MNYVLIGGYRFVSMLAHSPAGRVCLRFVRGIGTHSGGQVALRGVRRALPKAYDSLTKEDKWIVDQITELSVRVAANIGQDKLEIYISQQDVDIQSEHAAKTLADHISNAVLSRSFSLGYDSIFGRIERGGRILIAVDLIKQLILAGVGEMFDAHIAQTT